MGKPTIHQEKYYCPEFISRSLQYTLLAIRVCCFSVFFPWFLEIALKTCIGFGRLQPHNTIYTTFVRRSIFSTSLSRTLKLLLLLCVQHYINFGPKEFEPEFSSSVYLVLASFTRFPQFAVSTSNWPLHEIRLEYKVKYYKIFDAYGIK